VACRLANPLVLVESLRSGVQIGAGHCDAQLFEIVGGDVYISIETGGSH